MIESTIGELGEQRFEAGLKMHEGDKQAEVVYNQTGALILEVLTKGEQDG